MLLPKLWLLVLELLAHLMLHQHRTQAAARQAAAGHMGNAIVRIRGADPAFWVQEGERLAQPLVKGLRA